VGPAWFCARFLTLSDSADFLYKTTDYYAPQFERCIAWNDPTLACIFHAPQENAGLAVIWASRLREGKGFFGLHSFQVVISAQQT
jgi:hypothetical protein